MARLRGTPDDDLLRGGRDDDEIFGLRGNDHLLGRGGDDAIFGGGGADRIGGGAGNDVLNGGAGPDLINGGPGDDQIRGGFGRDRINGGPGADILSGGRGPDRLIYRSLDDALDRITDFDPDEGDELWLAGALAGAAIRMTDDGSDTTVSVRTAATEEFRDLVVLEDFRQPIDVWYGDVQQFGDPGEAQRWVNILGNVATRGLSSLTYSLNGGPEQALTVGPNGNRLAEPGDFNVDIDYRQLDPSAADDVVSIQARYQNGEVFTHDVTIDYEAGQDWPTDYSIDWAEVTDLQDVVQVVDGLWTFDADGVRPALPGYDRVLALGDITWDSYEVALTLETHDLSSAAAGGAVWFGMQWGGHTANPFGGQPLGGYIPGATFMLNGQAVILRGSDFFPTEENPRVGTGLPLSEGEVYNVLIRNERVATDTDLSDGLDRTYSIKIWGVGMPEPEDWAIQFTMVDQEAFGSFYLNAHFFDVTFGDIAIRELPEDEILISEDSLSTLFAGLPDAARMAGSDGGGALAAQPVANLSSLIANADNPAVAA